MKIPINNSFTVNDPIYALEMAKSGAVITYLPDFIVAQDLLAGSMQEVLSEWQARKRDVYAVYHNRSLMPLALKNYWISVFSRY